MTTKLQGGNLLWLSLPVLAGLLWASAGPFVRMLSFADMNTSTILFARGVFGTLILGLALLFFKRDLLKIKLRDLWLFLGAGLLGMMALNICYVYTINTLNLSLASVLLSMAPLFAIIFGAFFFKEKVTKMKLGAILLAIAGCVLVSGMLESANGNFSALGVLVGLASAFFYALNSLFSRLAMERGYHSVTITFYSLVAMAIVLAPTADWSTLGGYIAAAPAMNTVVLLLHSLCTAVLPYVLFTLALTHIGIGTTSAIASASEPIGATCCGLLLYGEVPTVLALIGIAIMIVAIVLLNMTPTPKTRNVEEELLDAESVPV